jgi:hypothetical protein
VQVKQMDVYGIPQSKASRGMMVIAGCDLVSRVIASYLADRIKGKTLHMYVVFTLALCLVNVAGSFAHTFLYMVVFVAGNLRGAIHSFW